MGFELVYPESLRKDLEKIDQVNRQRIKKGYTHIRKFPEYFKYKAIDGASVGGLSLENWRL
jgi:hypothetical protein